MPELPEVETVRRGLAPVMEGEVIRRVEMRRPDLRFPFPERFVERLEGQRIDRLGRRAKFLMAELDSGESLVMHLGMSGRFTISGKGFDIFAHETGAASKHDHVVMHMANGAVVTFNDPRRFGFMELYEPGAIEHCDRLSNLGPEPHSNAFSAAYLDEALQGKASPIKSVLLDQNVVAGLGNIYVCEALFRAGISPKRKAATVPGKRAVRLAAAVRDVILEAIEAGGSSISDYARTDGSLGYFQHSFRVYGREGEPCPTCGASVKRIVQSGRSSFYCSHCQR